MTPAQIDQAKELLVERRILMFALSSVKEHKTKSVVLKIYNNNPPYNEKNTYKKITRISVDKIIIIHEIEHQLSENKFKLHELGVSV